MLDGPKGRCTDSKVAEPVQNLGLHRLAALFASAGLRPWVGERGQLAATRHAPCPGCACATAPQGPPSVEEPVNAGPCLGSPPASNLLVSSPRSCPSQGDFIPNLLPPLPPHRVEDECPAGSSASQGHPQGMGPKPGGYPLAHVSHQAIAGGPVGNDAWGNGGVTCVWDRAGPTRQGQRSAELRWLWFCPLLSGANPQ